MISPTVEDTQCAASHFSCQFRNCHQRLNNGCFCNRYHTAFSTAAICRCWCPPTSLFLVSKSLRHLAQSVFFSKNRFVIMPTDGVYDIPEELPERLEASVFLRNVVPRDMLSWACLPKRRTYSPFFPCASGSCRRCRDSEETGWSVGVLHLPHGPGHCFIWRWLNKVLRDGSWEVTKGMIVSPWGKSSKVRVNGSKWWIHWQRVLHGIPA